MTEDNSRCSKVSRRDSSSDYDSNIESAAYRVVSSDDLDGFSHVEWVRPPSTALIIEKIRDPDSRDLLIKAATYLHEEYNINVYIEEYAFKELTEYDFMHEYHNSDALKIDFILSFGGDGTLLHISELFPKLCPPIMPFALGSLGFLTPFLAEEYKKFISSLIGGFFYVTTRTRIICEILRKDQTIEKYQSLNDITFKAPTDGGLASYECSIDGEFFTTVYGDGLILSTATGSTAYNLSAGGPMIHPSVSSIIWTPICAHSLNAHPLVFPDSIVLSLRIAPQSRSNYPNQIFIDSSKTHVYKGDTVIVHVSSFPFPTICLKQPMPDWLSSISNVLGWNQPIEGNIPSEEDSVMCVCHI